MITCKNGEPRIEQLLSSLEILLRTKPLVGVQKIKGMLRDADETNVMDLWSLLKRADVVDLYLRKNKETTDPIRKCSWHPGYFDGQNAIIVSKANLPVNVPNEYFDGVKEITDGMCRYCKERAIKEELK